MNKKIVRTVIQKCLGVKSGESFLIVCDDVLYPLAYDFYKRAKSFRVRALLVTMPPLKMHGEEPPPAVAEALKICDTALLMTSKSLSHTRARKRACKRYGTRIASLPGITEDIFRRSITINYDELNRNLLRMANYLSKGKRVEVYTDKGTHIMMSIEGRKGFSDNGLYVKRGAFGNLPAGEACLAPVEGTTNGRLIVDGSALWVGKIKTPREMIIKNGYIQNMPFLPIRSRIKSFGRCASNIAEFGIGLNPKAKVTGNILEDEKSRGTAHIGIGNNISFGGKVNCPCHLDFVFLNPVIFIDGKRVNY